MDRIARTYPAPSTNRYYQRHKYCGPSNLHPVNAPRFISSSAAPALLPAALLYAPASARADVCHSQHTQAQALSAHTHTYTNRHKWQSTHGHSRSAKFGGCQSNGPMRREVRAHVDRRRAASAHCRPRAAQPATSFLC